MNEVQTKTAERTDAGPLAASPPLCWKNILVAVDFCELSRETLKIAMGIARQAAAKLTLLHIVRVPASYSMDALPGVDELLTSARDCLETISQQIPPALLHEKRVQFAKQDIVHEIVNAALELPADLVVLATHGHGGLARMWHASIAERVVRQAPCPVLVVHGKSEFSATPPSIAQEPQNPFAGARS